MSEEAKYQSRRLSLLINTLSADLFRLPAPPSQIEHSNPINLSKYSITVPLESDAPGKAPVQNKDTILDSKQF